MDDEPRVPNLIARRSLVVGASAGLLAGAAMMTEVARADNASPDNVHVAASPVTSTIASTPISGWDYRYLAYTDFTNPNGTTSTLGGLGICAGSGFNVDLYASCDLPPGAYLRDLEIYASNLGSSTYYHATLGLWAAGSGTVTPVAGGDLIPGSGGIIATRFVVDPSTFGPYPFGTKTVVVVQSDQTTQFQVNGARIGFVNGNGTTAVRALTRAYDSRTSSVLTTGETRTIDLHAYSPPGTTAMVLSITILQPSAACFLKAFARDAATPTGALLYATPASAAAGMFTVPVSADGKIKIFASSTMHITLDVAGSVG